MAISKYGIYILVTWVPLHSSLHREAFSHGGTLHLFITELPRDAGWSRGGRHGNGPCVSRRFGWEPFVTRHQPVMTNSSQRCVFFCNPMAVCRVSHSVFKDVFWWWRVSCLSRAVFSAFLLASHTWTVLEHSLACFACHFMSASNWRSRISYFYRWCHFISISYRIVPWHVMSHSVMQTIVVYY